MTLPAAKRHRALLGPGAAILIHIAPGRHSFDRISRQDEILVRELAEERWRRRRLEIAVWDGHDALRQLQERRRTLRTSLLAACQLNRRMRNRRPDRW